jgi:predicted RNA-binding protein with PUA-like domain
MNMGRWLFKEEPTHYNFAQLRREGRTVWDGVSNALARKHLRQIRPGDRVFFYHTGKEKAIVGEMRVIGIAGMDSSADEAQEPLIEVEAVRLLPHPVSLARIKGDPLLADWELVRLPRLSVMPVSDEQWQRIEQLSEQG